MATGDQTDILSRLRRLMPLNWLAETAPIADGVASGFANAAAQVYALLIYAKKQARILTASDGWLDLACYDFLGLAFKRKTQESDGSFAPRVINEILRARNTRAGIIKAVQDLTGLPVYLFFEPANPMDTGGYGYYGAMGYSVAGRYGSLAYPNQFFIIPLKPQGEGIANVQGYRQIVGVAGGLAIGGYHQGAITYGRLADMRGTVTDRDINAVINATRSAGCTAWVLPSIIPPEGFLDTTFTLDRSSEI